jgi:hypothetical protein
MANANETDFYDRVFPVPDRVREKSYIKSREEYEKLTRSPSKTLTPSGRKRLKNGLPGSSPSIRKRSPTGLSAMTSTSNGLRAAS